MCKNVYGLEEAESTNVKGSFKSELYKGSQS